MSSIHSTIAKETCERAQRVLIGYLLTYPSMADEVLPAVPKAQACAFTVPVLRHVFEAIHDLHDRGAEISGHTVSGEFQRRKRTTAHLPKTFVECSDAASDEYRNKELGDGPLDYALAIIGGHRLELLREKAQRAVSFQDFVGVAEEAIALDAGSGGAGDYASGIGPVLDEVIETQQAIDEGRREPGYSWGIAELDDTILLRPGKLYTIAAQKGSGKTKFLLSILHRNLTRRHEAVPTFLFSLEMDRTEVGKMLLSRDAEIDSSLIFTKLLPSELFDDIRMASLRFSSLPLEVDCSPCLTVNQIISRIWRWKLKGRIPEHTGIVGVDFLQLIALEREHGHVSEATAIKTTAYALAEAAKKFQVCIIAVAQLNKQGDDKAPKIGFIEGSGGPAQASQGVLLLDLPRLRNKKKAQSEDGCDEFNIIVAKNRDGESGVTVNAKTDLSIGKFWGKGNPQLTLIK